MKKRRLVLKNEKNTIMKPNNKVFVDQLIQAVNMSDKKYGIKLKHPDVYYDPENYRDVLVQKSETNLAAIICSINGLDVKDYFIKDEETGISNVVKPIGLEDPIFTHESILRLDNKCTNYNTSSLIFRCRYLTALLSSYLGKIEKLSKIEADRKYDYKHNEDERRIMTNKDIVDDSVLFTKLLLKDNSSYQNIILKVHEHFSYMKKKNKHKKLRNSVNGHIIDIRRGMESNLMESRLYDDDYAIWMIIKSAYLLCTNNVNLKPLPSFKKIENATVKHDLIKLIEDLGKKIKKNKLYKKYPPMFKAYIEARPSIVTEYYKEARDNNNLRLGILALGFTKFVLNSDECDEFIDEMLCKGK